MTPRRSWVLSAVAISWAEVVANRLRGEYAATGTFTPTAVALMYSAYAAQGAAFASAARSPGRRLPLPRRRSRAVGGALAVAGAAVASSGMGRFGSVGQFSGTRPGSLVTAGPYRRTRNPQYLGLVAGLAGVALAARSAPAALLAASAWSTLDRWIPAEERRLSEAFGEPYLAYVREVPRWI